MDPVSKTQVLSSISDYYLNSSDFNGLPLYDLALQLGSSVEKLTSPIHELLDAGSICVLDTHVVNPHIIRIGFPDNEYQRECLSDADPYHTCLYPTPKHLRDIVKTRDYHGKPFKLLLALGEPQLSFQYFDPDILEFYRNDPRYTYQTDDICGWISVSDDFYQSDDMLNRDQVLLKSFGFAYNAEFDRVVCAFVWDLAQLSSEHQLIWQSRQLDSSGWWPHPDHYKRQVLGGFGDGVSLGSAFLEELWTINQMAAAMGREPLFRTDCGKYAHPRPPELSPLLRPTLTEYNSFVLALDKLLSDNINKAFFQEDVPTKTEHDLGNDRFEVHQRGTLTLLDEWIRSYFQADDYTEWDQAIKSLRKIRKLRQHPAHKLEDNSFDKKYIAQQRELMSEAHAAVRTIRVILSTTPEAEASHIDLPYGLTCGKIWAC